jgi:flavonoid 3'-monooxygenase
VAGTDTTSNTVEWTISELLRNPECMTKLQTELDFVVGTARVVTEADLPHLPYLQAVVKEVMRLYPQGAIFIPHVSLEATTVCGYEFPAGTWLMVNSLAIHLDESYWPNPQKFDPERFLVQREQELDVKGTNLHYMPFGIGRHQCPGMWLALLATQIGVARLVQAFDFSLANGEDPRKLDMTEVFCQSMPRMHPLVLKAHPRLAPHLY